MADYREAGQGLPTNAGPSDVVDQSRYVPMTYAGARGWVPFDLTERIVFRESEPVSETQAGTLSEQIGWEYFLAGISDPKLRPTLLGGDPRDLNSIVIDDHLAGVLDDAWVKDPALEHIRSQLEEVAAEELEHVGDVLPRQEGHVKGALGPAETAFNGITTGVATDFGELPSGGIRRRARVIGTHSPSPIVRPTGDVIDAKKPKVDAKRIGQDTRLGREAIARIGKLRGKAPRITGDQYRRVWGVESLGPDVQEHAEQLTPEEFQHLAIEDQVGRIWEEFEAEGNAGANEEWEIVVDDAPQGNIVSEVPGLLLDKLLSADDVLRAADRGEVEIVSAEELAAQETRDLDIAERREIREEAFKEVLTARDLRE